MTTNYNVPSYYKLPTDITIPTGGSNITQVNKFGFFDAIDDTERSIWDGAGSTNCNYQASAAPLNLSSDDANDTAAGTGARVVTLSGLDANYREISETLMLDGTTPVTTTQSFLRCHRQMVGQHTDGNAKNAGTLYVFTGTATDGEPDDASQIYSMVSPGMNQTLQCNYTIPANKIGILDFVEITHLGGNNVEATIRVIERPLGGVWLTKRKIVLAQARSPRGWKTPPPFAAKSDLEIRAQRTSGAGTMAMSGEFDLRLVPTA